MESKKMKTLSLNYYAHAAFASVKQRENLKGCEDI